MHHGQTKIWEISKNMFQSRNCGASERFPKTNHHAQRQYWCPCLLHRHLHRWLKKKKQNIQIIQTKKRGIYPFACRRDIKKTTCAQIKTHLKWNFNKLIKELKQLCVSIREIPIRPSHHSPLVIWCPCLVFRHLHISLDQLRKTHFNYLFKSTSAPPNIY